MTVTDGAVLAGAGDVDRPAAGAIVPAAASVGVVPAGAWADGVAGVRSARRRGISMVAAAEAAASTMANPVATAAHRHRWRRRGWTARSAVASAGWTGARFDGTTPGWCGAIVG